MLQNEPKWQLYLFDEDGQVVSDQNNGPKEKGHNQHLKKKGCLRRF